MDLGIADDGECAGHEQAAQIVVPLFTDTAEPDAPPARVLFTRDVARRLMRTKAFLKSPDTFVEEVKFNASDPSLDHSPNNWPLCSIENTFA